MAPSGSVRVGVDDELDPEAWDRLAGDFDEHVTPLAVALGEEVLDRLGDVAGLGILDVAAGSGGFALPAARRGAEVLAVDVTPSLVERLVARGREEQLVNLRARTVDRSALETGGRGFDLTALLDPVSLFSRRRPGLGRLVGATRRGGRVVVAALGAPRRAEWLGYFFAAAQAVIPGAVRVAMDPVAGPFRLPPGEELRGRLASCGLRRITLATIEWRIEVASGAHLVRLVGSSDPACADVVAALGDGRRSEVEQVLDGMLRERSGGRPSAVLGTEVDLAVGVV